ncbi:MAG: hypothetical protein WD431_24475 [Cyclobacteriaceae bacterium]
MDKKKIDIALQSAYLLLSSEIQSVEYEELKEEYSQAIQLLEIALKEIQEEP